MRGIIEFILSYFTTIYYSFQYFQEKPDVYKRQGDMLIWDIKLPKVESGDILAVLATGAYNYSMASNYNKLPIPAVVLVNSGRAEIIVKRQSYEQLIQNDVVPDWLE